MAPSLYVIVNDTVNLFHGSYYYLTVSDDCMFIFIVLIIISFHE